MRGEALIFCRWGVGAMDGAAIRGLRSFIETYGAVGMLFDVEIETKWGRLARLGTGRFVEVEGVA